MTHPKFGIVLTALLAMMIGCGDEASERANQEFCMTHLKGITKGCFIYATENEDKYPENLKVLVDYLGDQLPPDALRCPGDKYQRTCSYLYVAPTSEADDRTLMLCDLKGNHDHVRCVVFGGMEERKMTEAEFQAALKLPRNAAFAAALAKAGG